MSLPRSLYCSICSDVLTCPVRTPCGHVFCKECLFRWMHRNATCPIDRNPIRPETVQDDLFVASLLTEVVASPVVEKESSWKTGLSFPERLSTRENTLNCFSGFSTISTSIPTREYSSAHSFAHSADIDIDSVASSSVSPNQFSSSMAVFAPVTSPLSIPQSDSNPSSTSSSPSSSPRSIPSLSPLQIGSPESPRGSLLPSRSSYIEREINSLRSYIQSQSILVRRLMQNLSQNQSRDSAKSTEVAQKMFAQLDRKKNGYVEEQSVNRLLAHFSITPAQARKIMSLANPNKNGKLVLFEFVVAIELVKKVLRGETLPESLSEPFLTYVSYRLTKDVVTQSESDDSNEDDDDDSDSDDDDDFDEDYEDDSDGDAVCDEQPWWGPPEDLAPGSNEII